MPWDTNKTPNIEMSYSIIYFLQAKSSHLSHECLLLLWHFSLCTFLFCKTNNSINCMIKTLQYIPLSFNHGELILNSTNTKQYCALLCIGFKSKVFQIVPTKGYQRQWARTQNSKYLLPLHILRRKVGPPYHIFVKIFPLHIL